ncbi:SapC family protein [Parvularcula sp. LCG005]|uniref:SapC family protein n=1 Tax=Parvularcula sp. LCG005 TaxID=3078805 RepID=UPI0029437341|nr:SapC family protein [Parvularcula sp. LCG005]WOI52669.1 SapC family protein [Parvularcula sp. LCG005]
MMSKIALLNNVDHQNLRVVTTHGPEFGDDVNRVLVFPAEYADVQREYPILLVKDSNDAYQTVALLGFENGENLFLSPQGWQARYIPAIQQRGPFSIGFQSHTGDDGDVREPMIHIDLDHPRVSETEGHPVFLPQGGNSPYLEYVSGVLRILHEGLEFSQKLFAALEKFDLIEPLKLEIQLSEENKIGVSGYSTVSEEKLRQLDGDALAELSAEGYLGATYMLIASLGNVRRLIDLKTLRLQQAAG